ncbi:putative ankyrin repeat protein YahD [Cotesia typhae]|uniref:putative ankyrin repeat protein YahD n=1 Tax=Cotesia typhae TaxID=2053667 RepID=UPI003D689352
MSSDVSKILIPDESINIVNLLSVCLSEGIDINSIKDASGNTLLHIAVESMNIEIVRFLLKCNNVNTEIFNYFYEFPMDIAIKNGYLDIVKIFLVEGIDVNLSRNGKESFLYSAVKFRHLDIVETLCSFGANIDDRCSFGVEEGFTPFMLASKLGDQAIVSFLKNKGADINAKSVNKTTALYHAVEKNHIDMVKLLLEWSANTAVINESAIERKFTPLHVSCKNGNQKIVKLLLENKTEINAQAWYNKTPLHLAIQYQHLDVVQFLLYYGADPEALCNTWTEEKLTPLHLACKHKNNKIVLALLNKKVNINSVFVGGYTPLYLAVFNQNLISAQLLLKKEHKLIT